MSINQNNNSACRNKTAGCITFNNSIEAIPEYPDFRDILIEDKPIFDELLKNNPPLLSAYTFTNLFAWRIPHKAKICRLNGCIIVQHNHSDKPHYLQPIGNDPVSAMINLVVLEDDVKFISIDKPTSEKIIQDTEFYVHHDLDNSDYLYLTSDLAELHGKKYDGKRNFVKRAIDKGAVYEIITEDTIDECIAFAEEWCDERMCDIHDGLSKERIAVREMLENFSTLKIFGGAVRVDGKICAFTLGEQLNPNTVVVHIEKADQNIDGMYQFVNNQFCKKQAIGYEFINREQDLGIEGLRRAKKSYHPISMVESYKVSSRPEHI
ncbi:MAG: phosphatidylglycerol lysyltransferase domain-containing protein [Armatimonadota bacterium]